MMQKLTYVDPPEGWRYGFPKALPQPDLSDPAKKTDIYDWLVANGYPEDLIREMGDAFRYRMWEEWV